MKLILYCYTCSTYACVAGNGDEERVIKERKRGDFYY